MKIAQALAVSLLTLTPAFAQDAGTVAKTEIDPEAYVGTWYEIARTPAKFQEMCTGGVTATYALAGEKVTVTNRCDGPGGAVATIEGTATVVGGNFNTLDVQFPVGDTSQGVNYTVAAASDVVDGKYQWAAVRSPEENIGWILSRTPELDAATRAEAVKALETAGVDVSQLKDTAQPPQSYKVGE